MNSPETMYLANCTPEDSAMLKRFFDGMGLPMPQSGISPSIRAEREAARQKEHEATRAWLEKMGMATGQPEGYLTEKNIRKPGDAPDEYFETSDGGRLVFLDKFGCVIRVTPHIRRLDLPANPHILRPLYQLDTPHFRIELYPGIHCPVTNAEARAIDKKLNAEYGIKNGDPHRFNFGFLPTTRFPLMLDIDNEWIKLAAKNLNDTVHAVAEDLQADDPQETLYAKLRQTLRKAWEKATELQGPDVRLIAAFWQDCHDMKQKGQLLAAWSELEDPEPPSSQIFYRDKLITAAKAYAPRLDAAGPQ